MHSQKLYIIPCILLPIVCFLCGGCFTYNFFNTSCNITSYNHGIKWQTPISDQLVAEFTVQFPIPYEFLTQVTLKLNDKVFSKVSGGSNICRIVGTMKHSPTVPELNSTMLSNMIRAIVYC